MINIAALVNEDRDDNENSFLAGKVEVTIATVTVHDLEEWRGECNAKSGAISFVTVLSERILRYN